MDRGLLLPSSGVNDALDVSRRAAALGYDAVWTPELWGTEAFVRLTAVATAVPDIRIGTAIANVYSRSPAVLAMAAATLDQVAAGRFTLGLGVSTAKAVEDLHGLSFDRPVTRARETIELVRAFTRGDGPIHYDGEVFSVADFPSLEVTVPIYHAALGPANRRVVGRLCDGWIPHNVPFDRLDAAFEVVAEAARAADRDPDDIAVAPYVPAAVSPDGDAARDAVRGHVAYYVGSGEGYRRAVATTFPDEADRIAAAWGEGDRDAARAAVTEAMVDGLGVAGTPDAAARRFDRLVAETVIDHPIVVLPPGLSDEHAALTLETLAP